MRGKVDPQQSLFAYFSPESRVPEGHPLRAIKQHADAALKAISPVLDALYADKGRPSVAVCTQYSSNRPNIDVSLGRAPFKQLAAIRSGGVALPDEVVRRLETTASADTP